MGKLAKKAAAAAEAKKQDFDQSEDTSESSTNPDEECNQFEDLFTAVMTATDTDNRPLHTEFQLIPSKRKYPEYFEIIECPIDLKSVAVKIQNNEYTCLAEMEKDLLLMTKNACLFNEPGSQIYKNAKTLKKVGSSFDFHLFFKQKTIVFVDWFDYRSSGGKKQKEVRFLF